MNPMYGMGAMLKEYMGGGKIYAEDGAFFPRRRVTSRQTLRPGMEYKYANPDNREELLKEGFKFRTTPQGKTVVITPEGDKAIYKDRGEYGTELKFKQRMENGGLVKQYRNGTMLTGDEDPTKEGDPKKDPNRLSADSIDPSRIVSPRYMDEQVLTLSDFPENEGMLQATSEGKIDAFNFNLPESGSLDDLDDQTKQAILATDFGKEHLSGQGSLDKQYNVYATTAINTINNNPKEALQAINAAIDSGNESFQGLKGMSDAEKLQTAKSYMTDKKIGNFHTAFNIDTKSTARVSAFDPTMNTKLINVEGQNTDPIVIAVGDRAVPDGKGMQFRDDLIAAGIDPTKESPELIKFFNAWVEENGYEDARTARPVGGRVRDVAMFMDENQGLYQEQKVQRWEDAADQRRQDAAARAEAQKQAQKEMQQRAREAARRRAQQNMALGGLVEKYTLGGLVKKYRNH